jgi:hypothetical protein
MTRFNEAATLAPQKRTLPAGVFCGDGCFEAAALAPQKNLVIDRSTIPMVGLQ